MNDRLARLRTYMAQRGIGVFMLRNESAIYWITGFDDLFDGEDAFALIVTPDQAILHTDSRYAAAAEPAVAGTALTLNLESASHSVLAARYAAQEGETAALAIEDGLTLREFRALKTALAAAVPQEAKPANAPGQTVLAAHERLRITSDVCVGLRAVKDAGEIARMRAAQAITDAAFTHIIGFMRPGMTEREVQLELEHFMLCHGASGLAFSSIVATGANGACAHAIPGQTVLEAGHCVVLDFGARAQGYCSDMTRMVFLGEPSPELRQAYDVLRTANETVEAALKPGMTGAEAHNMAEQVLANGGFAGKMGHGLGHGVGIDIHESPNLSPRNTQPLEPGNVVTVEPGIYLAGEFGMRLEDFGLITESGFNVFTQSPHDMVII